MNKKLNEGIMNFDHSKFVVLNKIDEMIEFIQENKNQLQKADWDIEATLQDLKDAKTILNEV